RHGASAAEELGGDLRGVDAALDGDGEGAVAHGADEPGDGLVVAALPVGGEGGDADEVAGDAGASGVAVGRGAGQDLLEARDGLRLQVLRRGRLHGLGDVLEDVRGLPGAVLGRGRDEGHGERAHLDVALTDHGGGLLAVVGGRGHRAGESRHGQPPLLADAEPGRLVPEGLPVQFRAELREGRLAGRGEVVGERAVAPALVGDRLAADRDAGGAAGAEAASPARCVYACVNRALAHTNPNVMPGGYWPTRAGFGPPVPWLDTARVAPVLGRTTTMDAGCGRPASARSALRW